MQQKTKIGIVGCGNISDTYLKVARTFDILEVTACADVIPDLAQAKAAEYGVPKACSPAELLADPDIEIVVNLTPPAAHAEIALQALEAGKSIYNEKPLAIEREDAQRMLQLAAEKHLRVGCAPDTFMGAGLQTCRKLIDDGAIGRPIAASAFMLGRGPEPWHPNPEFFYQRGGGPMFDMGPYYLTALVSLLGPVKRVTGATQISFPERVIGSGPKKGNKIAVEIPTHIVGVLEFAAGVVGTLTTSFDVWAHQLPRIEIYGAEGTLSVPDPNTFGGPVKLWRPEKKEWEEMPLLPLRAENSRSLGVADMAYALRSGRPHRANGALAYHVLDLMHSIHDAAREGRHITVTSACERPAPMPLGLLPSQLDD
ncbi:MAG: Gfo/Idh/MocA family protein [Anaerolineae bacterium]